MFLANIYSNFAKRALSAFSDSLNGFVAQNFSGATLIFRGIIIPTDDLRYL